MYLGRRLFEKMIEELSPQKFTSSESTIETREKGVKNLLLATYFQEILGCIGTYRIKKLHRSCQMGSKYAFDKFTHTSVVIRSQK